MREYDGLVMRTKDMLDFKRRQSPSFYNYAHEQRLEGIVCKGKL